MSIYQSLFGKVGVYVLSTIGVLLVALILRLSRIGLNLYNEIKEKKQKFLEVKKEIDLMAQQIKDMDTHFENKVNEV